MKEKMTALLNDQRLMDLAKYKRTNGLLKDAKPEDLIAEFTSLKKKILNGKSTLKKLEESIYTKYGVQEDIDMPIPGRSSMGFLPPTSVENSDHKEIEGFGRKE